ncbi:amphi-Trp domain-containing protein [Halomarina salina]|uniref:Amphi-Trp domain-containing protein n=1 Tax=Halomarina salina TaxID=1872699 RepID=A0ABD5RQ17_9EURY
MREIETERVVTRNEAAEYLRQFADKLAEEGHQFGGHSTAGEQGRTTGTTTGQSTTEQSAAGQSTSGTTQQSPGRTTDTTRGESNRNESTTGTTGGDVTDSTHDQTADTTQGTSTTDEVATEGVSPQYGKVTFLVGNDSATVNPPEEVTLNVEVGEDSSMMSSGAEKVTFSLHWDKDTVPESDELRIE